MTRIRSRRAASPIDELTPRERRVLALVVEALSNEEIADRLGCTMSVVKKALEALTRKLGCRNRTMLAVEAIRGKWLERPGDVHAADGETLHVTRTDLVLAVLDADVATLIADRILQNLLGAGTPGSYSEAHLRLVRSRDAGDQHSLRRPPTVQQVRQALAASPLQQWARMRVHQTASALQLVDPESV